MAIRVRRLSSLCKRSNPLVVKHARPMAVWQIEYSKNLWQIRLSPSSELGVIHLPLLECYVEQALSLMGIADIEEASYPAGHRRALIELRDIALRVVLQVKVSALPRHTGKYCFTGRFKARMVIAGDELDPAQAALNQVVQKGSPMHLGFR